MKGVKHPAFLILPAYLIGLALTLFCATSLSDSGGVFIAAGLCLVMLTPASLLHPMINAGARDDDGDVIVVHAALYALCLGLGIAFSLCFMPYDVWPITFLTESQHLSWLQLGFIVVQQALYFGIHAFTPAE
jgi:hypothetical protein